MPQDETLSAGPDAAAPTADAGAIQNWMVAYISSVIDVPADDFPVNDTFDVYGMDSVEIVIMSGMIEEAYGVTIESSDLFENPTVSQFSAHLAGRLASANG